MTRLIITLTLFPVSELLSSRIAIATYMVIKMAKVIRDRPIMLIFYPLYYAIVLKTLAYYAQYCAQEQELCSVHIIC